MGYSLSLQKLQDRFLARFFSDRISGDFYLTGGTALARFYFHHRESVDLDLFTHNQNLDFNGVNLAIIKILQELALTIEKQVTTPTFLQYICKDKKGTNLKVDIVKDIPKHFGKIESRGKIKIDSTQNIGSNKILAVFGRTDPKDFIDLYLIMQKAGFKFDQLYDQAKQKDLGLSYFYFANSVANIEKIETWPELKVNLNRQNLIKYYTNLSRKLLLKIKPKE